MISAGRVRTLTTVRLTALKILVVTVGVAFAAPAGYVIWRNYTYDANFIELISSPRILGALERSLRLAVTVSISAALLGVGLAWLVTRTDIVMRRSATAILVLPLVYPSFLGAAAFQRTMSSGGLIDRALKTFDTAITSTFGLETSIAAAGFGYNVRGFWGAWLILTLFTYPYVFMPVAARLTRLSCASEESARLLGDNTAAILRKIVWPQIAPSTAAGTLLVFLYCISDYGAVQMMRYDTLTRAIAMNHLARPDMAFGLSLVLLVVAITVVIAQRRLLHISQNTRVERNETTSLGTPKTSTYPLGKWRTPASAATALVALAAVGLPLIAIIEWAYRGVLRAQQGHHLSISTQRIFQATLNTAEISLLGAAATIVLVAPVARLRSRSQTRIGTATHTIIISGYAIPGILVALALRFWTLRASQIGDLLYDSMLLFVLAYALRFGSLALATLTISFSSVPRILKRAAATLGATPLRRFVTIDAALILPGVAAAFGLVLLSVMKELPIALFVSPLGYRTLAARIFTSFEEAFVAEAGIMACILVAISATLSWLLLIRRSV